MVAESDVLPRMIAVFFYGLFMNIELLNELGLHPSDSCPAAVDGLALIIGQRATLVPNATETVHGMVMTLSHAEIDVLYSGASVALYRPEAVLARLRDGSSVPALCFNLPRPPEPSEKDLDYARQLADLGRRLGLPTDYLRSLCYDNP